MPVAQLDAALGGDVLSRYLRDLGLKDVSQVVTSEDVGYFSALGRYLTQGNLPSLKCLCKLQLINAYGDYLTNDVAQALDRMVQFEQYMDFNAGEADCPPFAPAPYASPYASATGAELPAFVRDYAQEDLAVAYANAYAPEGAREKLTALTHQITQAFCARIRALDWMAERTKQSAIQKLDAIGREFVSPDAYPHIEIKDTLFDTMASVHVARLTCAINQANDRAHYRKHWEMASDTVNACYDNVTHTICVPAGILGAPFYDADRLVGSIGLIIGHELTHGFDDNGSHDDENGYEKDWWTPEDRAVFAKKTREVAAYYSRWPYRAGRTQAGDAIVGECIADLGSLGMMMDLLDGDPDAQREALINLPGNGCRRAPTGSWTAS